MQRRGKDQRPKRRRRSSKEEEEEDEESSELTESASRSLLLGEAVSAPCKFKGLLEPTCEP